MAFTQKFLQFTFDLGPNSAPFADGTMSQTIAGFRSSVDVINAGAPSMEECHVKILGLDDDTMNSLTKLGPALLTNVGQQNRVTVSAGDQVGGYSTVFIGPISQAWADIQSAPDIPFVITAVGGLADALTAAPATSVKGGADVATIMQGLAGQMGDGGYTFENNGVSVQISNPNLPGTLRQQAYSLAQQANINIVIEKNTLAIWPKGTARGSGSFIVSPETGMVGYPTFTNQGIVVRTLFNPDVLFGAQIQVTTSLTPAAGAWTIYRISHHLESETVNGKWFTEMECYKLGGTIPT